MDERRPGAVKGSRVGMPPKGTGKVVHYDGFPEGLEAVEKVYASGIYAGQTYLRFQGKVVSLDAEERGIDPAEAFAAYEKVRAEVAEKKKEEAQKAKEAKELLDGQKKAEAIEAFRSRFGPLNGATIGKLPGWRGESKVLEGCG